MCKNKCRNCEYEVYRNGPMKANYLVRYIYDNEKGDIHLGGYYTEGDDPKVLVEGAKDLNDKFKLIRAFNLEKPSGRKDIEIYEDHLRIIIWLSRHKQFYPKDNMNIKYEITSWDYEGSDTAELNMYSDADKDPVKVTWEGMPNILEKFKCGEYKFIDQYVNDDLGLLSHENDTL